MWVARRVLAKEINRAVEPSVEREERHQRRARVGAVVRTRLRPGSLQRLRHPSEVAVDERPVCAGRNEPELPGDEALAALAKERAELVGYGYGGVERSRAGASGPTIATTSPPGAGGRAWSKLEDENASVDGAGDETAPPAVERGDDRGDAVMLDLLGLQQIAGRRVHDRERSVGKREDDAPGRGERRERDDIRIDTEPPERGIARERATVDVGFEPLGAAHRRAVRAL
jgi:hypothetical protein